MQQNCALVSRISECDFIVLAAESATLAASQQQQTNEREKTQITMPPKSARKDIYELDESTPTPHGSPDGKRRRSGDDEQPARKRHKSRKGTTADDRLSDEDSIAEDGEGSLGQSVGSAGEEESPPDPETDEDYSGKGRQKSKPKAKGRAKSKPSPKRDPRPRGQTKKQKPKSAERVEVSSSSEHSDSDESIPDRPSNLQPAIEYSEHWSEEQERKLRRDWSADDQFLVEASSADEITLWRKAATLFQCAAPDLIQPTLLVSKADAHHLVNPDTGKEWKKNPNWSPDFCKTLGMIICLPYFKNRLDFLQYVLLKAVVTRVGDDPRNRQLDHRIFQFSDPIVEKFSKKLEAETDYDEDERMNLEEILRSVLVQNYPEHWKFSQRLDKVVKKGAKVDTDDDTCNLRLCDLTNVVSAWSRYVNDNKLSLPNIAKYKDEFNKLHPNRGFKTGGNKRARRDEFYSWKKEWMLKTRRQKIMWASEVAANEERAAGRTVRHARKAMDVTEPEGSVYADQELPGGSVNHSDEDAFMENATSSPRRPEDSQPAQESLPPNARASPNDALAYAMDVIPLFQSRSAVPRGGSF